MNFIFLFLVTMTLIENVCPNPIAHHGVEQPSRNSLSRNLNEYPGGKRKLGISWASNRRASGKFNENDERPTNENSGHSTHTLHKHGEPCNTADTPIQIGCKTYSSCRRTEANIGITDGVIMQETCETNYFAVQIVSASGENDATCRHWDELDENRKRDILTDPICTICSLITEGSCSSQFKYRKSNGQFGAVNTCPGDTVMDVLRKGCIEPCDTTGNLLAECRVNGKCAHQ